MLHIILRSSLTRSLGVLPNRISATSLATHSSGVAGFRGGGAEYALGLAAFRRPPDAASARRDEPPGWESYW